MINKVYCGTYIYSSIKPKLQRSSPTQYLIFFSFFVLFCLLICAVVFYKYLYLKNCYLIKCINKQQEKYHVSREKIVHCILNIWINNLNFYHLLQFTYCEKSELITIWSFFKQGSNEFFLRTDSNYYFPTWHSTSVSTKYATSLLSFRYTSWWCEAGIIEINFLK